MPDRFTPAQRSAIMARIKGKGTSPELSVGKIARRLGYRFRTHVDALPGKPDIVFPRLKKAILVNGCFWHGHRGCKRAALPSTNVGFWRKKITANTVRDAKKLRELRRLGWKVKIIWQCRIKNTMQVVGSVRKFLKGA